MPNNLSLYYDGINMADICYNRPKAYYTYNIKYYDIFANMRPTFLKFR